MRAQVPTYPVYQRPLPNALQRGINVSHIWGSMSYWESQRFASQPGARWPMIYDGPTTASIFIGDDAKNIHQSGFGHVRFFFDPLLCGYNLGGYVYPSPTNITPGMGALLQDIREANEHGLAVILNFFPYWISYEHNYRTVIGELITGPNNEWTDNAKSWKRTWIKTTENPWSGANLYPGPWRKDFAMHYGNVSGTNQNHPLPKLWKGITQILQAEGFTPEDVYLQPISEAQTGFSDPKNFGTTPLIHSLYVNGDDAFNNRYLAWRKIQAETIQAIWLVDPGYKVLVTSQESFPWSYRNEYTALGGQGMDGFTQFEPYTKADLDGVEPDNLIYTFHMYSPYDFTHNAGITGELEHYVNKVADPDPGIFPPSNRDDFLPSPPTTVSPHVRLNEYHFNGTRAHFGLMKSWLKSNFSATEEFDETTWAPPMMITEFGAWRKSTDAYDGDPLGKVITIGPRSGPVYDAQFPLDKERARWVWDIRKLAEDNSYGWSYFDYAGGFRAFEGQLFGFDHSNLFKTSPPPDAMVPRFNQALFGGTRP